MPQCAQTVSARSAYPCKLIRKVSDEPNDCHGNTDDRHADGDNGGHKSVRSVPLCTKADIQFKSFRHVGAPLAAKSCVSVRQMKYGRNFDSPCKAPRKEFGARVRFLCKIKIDLSKKVRLSPHLYSGFQLAGLIPKIHTPMSWCENLTVGTRTGYSFRLTSDIAPRAQMRDGVI